MADDKVGYGNPPRHTRFAKGNTEHLKRKKKKSPKEGQAFRNLMNERAPVRKGGKAKYERRIDLLVRKLVGSSLKGSVADANALLKMHAQLKQSGDMNPTIIWVTEADLKV